MARIEDLTNSALAAIDAVDHGNVSEARRLAERTVARLYGTAFATYDPAKYRGKKCALVNWALIAAYREAREWANHWDLRDRFTHAVEAVQRGTRASTATLVKVADDAASRFNEKVRVLGTWRLATDAVDAVPLPHTRTTLAADLEVVYSTLYAGHSVNPSLDALDALSGGRGGPLLLEVLLRSKIALRLLASKEP